MLVFLFFKFLVIYFWLCWVSVAAWTPLWLQRVGLLSSGSVASRGGVSCCGARAQCREAQASVIAVSGCSSQALGHRLSSCGTWV